ncbi:hypothetical protein Z517_09938 [Fonsecaea pedrosoi CBS 271.37]|uniref:Unplaced genomic scaffold supercont1.6, whole genome shotgun sequence n=1 Tax=Fonsecaea pedrosoi CBS 271.37 TaxID=1442368 RepID=A0A0D2ETG3_9EURO|nr:uncharacterized protein Z517_09938 [Fonsecaea pedrosoi CBS 271.37]KIW77492.1 hypothetical protein Z517_09938 [Fonsecaea pedrosoi CBS 271.37]
MTSTTPLPKPLPEQEHPRDQPTHPASTPQGSAVPKTIPLEKRGTKFPQNNRPTHFVCFPLVSDESVSQLSRSLAHFRSLTTPLPSTERGAAPERDGEGQELDPNSTAPEQAGNETQGRDADQALRIIPESAHRPPGTFHLTLGVMHLPSADDLENAVAVLQQIDYLDLLRRAELGGGDKSGRGRNQKRPKSEAVDTAGEIPSSSIVQTQEESQSVRAKDADHEPEEKGSLHETAKEVGAALSSPLQTIQSLTREISPPRVSAPSLSSPYESRAPDTQPPPITISLTSLGTFPSTRSARVFYAHPHDPTGRLQRFGNMVRDIFRDAGLIAETRPLVLHATVANLIYVKGKGRGRGRSGGGKWKGKSRGGDDGNVDARGLLRLFNQGRDTVTDAGSRLEGAPTTSEPSDQPVAAPFIWAENISIRSIRICKMGAVPSATPGWGLEYPPVAEKVFQD